MSKYFKAIVLENTALNKHFKLLTIDAGSLTLDSQHIPLPGQFYMLQTNDTYDPLLKRPFSIFRHEDNSLSFLYRIRGKGTLSLSHLRKGDIIDVIGPLGNGYPTPEGDFIAVAGGIGIASLFPLLSKFKKRAYLFYGARSKDELLMIDEAKALSKEVFAATDDGSEGQRGLITDLLKDSLLTTHYSLPIYACGPLPMFKELLKLATRYLLFDKCYVSLEEHMACGVGACLGCVVKVRSQEIADSSQEWTYKRVCKEGPILNLKEILFDDTQ